MLSCVNNAGKKKKLYNKAKKCGKTDDWKAFAEARKIMKKNLRQARAKHHWPTFLRARWRMTPNHFGLMWKIFAKNTRGLLISNLRIILWVITKPRQIYWISSFQVFSQKKDQGRFHHLAFPTLPLRTWLSRLKVLKLSCRNWTLQNLKVQITCHHGFLRWLQPILHQSSETCSRHLWIQKYLNSGSLQILLLSIRRGVVWKPVTTALYLSL